MKTLYISDLDGTLLGQDVQLSENTITILNELIKNGLMFSIATARSIASVKPILKRLTINLPVVLMNGVCIYDLWREEYINIEPLSITSIDYLLFVIKQHKLMGFVYVIKDGQLFTYYETLGTSSMQEFYKERVKKYQKQFIQVENFSMLREEPIIYFTLMDHKENLEPIYGIFKQYNELNCVFYKDNYSQDLWYLEIFSKNASKYHALCFLRNYLSLDSIVSFGDNRNDLALFEASDHKYAVANAVTELKDRADAVIGSNTDDGVAMWLKENLLHNL